jgi:peroxiredoxin
MRPDIIPGGAFPDYELPDHAGVVRTLSELQGRDPLILTLARGHYCPKEHQQHLELAAHYPKIAVAYTQVVTIATDEHHTLQEFRNSVGAQWTFLSDPGRIIQRDLDIAEYTDPDNDPMIPHTLVLAPGLVIHSIYNGYWFWGRPSFYDLWRDLRAVTAEIRPDWDLAAPGLRAAWDAGDRSPFHGWDTRPAPLACLGRRLDVVVDADGGQQAVRAALVDPHPRLRRQVAVAPADAVVLQGAPHAVVGHRAVLQADAAARGKAPAEERAQLGGAVVGVSRAERGPEVPVRREGGHHRLGVPGRQAGLVAADDVTGADGAGREDRRADGALLLQRPLAAVGAERHRQVVGGFRDDGHRPGQLAPAVVHVGEQLHHRPVAGNGAGHRLGAGVQAGQPG